MKAPLLDDQTQTPPLETGLTLDALPLLHD
jgi:hypothetical protein